MFDIVLVLDLAVESAVARVLTQSLEGSRFCPS